MRISVALVFLIMATSFAVKQKWFSYENKEAKMSINFPAQFEETTTEKEKYTTYKARVNNGGMLYMLTGSIHEKSLETDRDELLATSVEKFKTSLNAELLSTEPIKIKGVKGTYAVMNIGDSNSKLEYRVFLKEDKQYQIISVQLESEYDQKMADAFFNSFKILK